MIRATTFAGRRVAVFGLGRSGNATCRSLMAGGAEVAAWDDNEASRAETIRLGLPLVDLTAADWTTFAALVLAPGVPLTHPAPHWTVERARAAGVEVIGDIELFFRERAAIAPEAPVIAITGTNGKSTTTALTAHLLQSAGLDVQMGGNIGVPVLALEPPAHGRFHVLEMSSFQIDLTPSLRPTVGVLINITPDHLDRHGTMENYASVKERLVTQSVWSVVGIDDEPTRVIHRRLVAAAERQSGPAAVSAITAGEPVSDFSLGIVGEQVVARLGAESMPLIDISSRRNLRGRHNAQNTIAAAAIVFSAPIAAEAITALAGDGVGGASTAPEALLAQYRAGLDQGLATYPGLPHRMEEVGRLAKPDGEILLVNDSKATNAASTENALAAFDRDIHWILGGKPKEGGITSLAAYFPRIARAYLIGQAADEFAATLEGVVPFVRSGTLEIAVSQATEDALASAAAEPVVLLSPACASYDQFRSFEHRGDEFRRQVQAIPGVVAIGRDA